jgi:hypothetical protein
MKNLLIGIVIILLLGCAQLTRTIYVPEGDAVKLRETIEDVKVWVKPANEEAVAGKLTLFEGWY